MLAHVLVLIVIVAAFIVYFYCAATSDEEDDMYFMQGDTEIDYVRPLSGINELKEKYDVDFNSHDDRLGRGAFGVVVKATTKYSKIERAIKMIDSKKFKKDKKALKLLRDEILVL